MLKKIHGFLSESALVLYGVLLMVMVNFGEVLFGAELGTAHGWAGYPAYNKPAELSDLVSIRAGSGYVLGLRSDGNIALWGANSNGQLVPPAGLSNVIEIAAGYYVPMALTQDGRVYAWGAWGHVSLNEIVNVPPSVTNAVAIAAGMAHCVALRADGVVIAWGNNTFGQTNVPPNLRDVVTLGAGQAYSMAVTAAGKIVAWGNTGYYGAVPASASNVISVAAGPFGHALALRGDGTVVAWGNNSNGQATVPAGLKDVIAIATGDLYSAALRSDGSVVAWGSDDNGQKSVPGSLPKAIAIAAGSNFGVILSKAPFVDRVPENMTVSAGDSVTFQAVVSAPVPWTPLWMKDGISTGRAERNLTIPDVQAVDSGSYSLIASNEFGFSQSAQFFVNVQPSVPRWKRQPAHQTVLAGGEAVFSADVIGTEPLYFQWEHEGNVIEGATNRDLVLSPVSLAQEGEYRLTAWNDLGQIRSEAVYLVAGLPRIISEPVSQRVRPGWTVELNSEVLSAAPLSLQWFKDGQEIVGATAGRLLIQPVQEADNGEYVLEATNEFGSVRSRTVRVEVVSLSVAVSEPGVVLNWGNNWLPTWRFPYEITDAVAVAAGAYHGLVLRQDGSLRVWGNPQDAPLMTIPASATNVAAIYAGWYNNLVLRKDGTVVAWGSGGENYGQSIIPPGTDHIVGAAGGARHSLLLRDDGTVIALPTYLNVPANVTNILSVAAGDEFSLALASDGRVLGWAVANADPNSPPAYEIFSPKAIRAMAAGEQSAIALASDGSVLTWQFWGARQWQLEAGLSNAVAVAAGRGFAALLANGEARGWGSPLYSSVPAGIELSSISGGLLHVEGISLAPVFDTQPEDQTLYSGGTGRLEAAVRSATPPAFQWFFENAPIEGATNRILEFTGARPHQSGRYFLRAKNGHSERASRTAVVSVEGRPEIGRVSPDQQLLAGESLQLEVLAYSIPAGSIQWRFNGFPIPGETNSMLRIKTVSESMTGTFSVAASNAYGVTLSQPIEVTVLPGPAHIVEQPHAPESLPEGSPLELRVAAQGSAPLVYQWYFNSTPIPGATSAFFSIDRVTQNENGSYYVKVSNAHGSEESLPVPVRTFRAPPNPEVAGGNRIGRAGKRVVLEAVHHSSADTKFQWRFNGLDLQDETSPFLLLDPLLPAHAGHYSVVAANDAGSAESAAIEVRVLPALTPGLVRSWGSVQGTPPALLAESVAAGSRHAIALLPDGTLSAWGGNSYSQATVPPGLSNIVLVEAGQDFNLALRSDGTVAGWGRNDSGQATPPPGLTDVIALSAGATHSLALKADGTVVAWGNTNLTKIPTDLQSVSALAAGPAYSLVALQDRTVRAWGGSVFGGLRPPTNVPPGLTGIIAVAASQDTAYALSSTGTITSWGRTLSRPPEATNIMVLAAGASEAIALRKDGLVFAWGDDSQGQVRGVRGLSNIVAVAAGDSSTLVISTEPKILSRSPDQVVADGASVLLSVSAAGTPPLTYQWLLNNVPIPEANDPNLIINQFGAASEGMYSVEVRNAYAVAKSQGTLLSRGVPPAISTQPASQKVRLGAAASFAVQATGAGPLKYQWMLNGTNVFMATNALFSLSSVIYEDAGKVQVRVSNSFGVVLSSEAELTVEAAMGAASLKPEPLPEQGLTLRMHVEANRKYSLLFSRDLQQWVPIQSFTSGGELFELVMPTSDGAYGFYKLLSE